MTILGQAWGGGLAAGCLGVVAAVLGVAHHETWVVVPAVLGLFTAGWALLTVRRHYRKASGTLTPELARWWKERGLWLVLVGTAPTYVALVGAVLSTRSR